jgi:hypothetical protein
MKDLMREIGQKAKDAAAELAYAKPERKYAALILSLIHISEPTRLM